MFNIPDKTAARFIEWVKSFTDLLTVPKLKRLEGKAEAETIKEISKAKTEAQALEEEGLQKVAQSRIDFIKKHNIKDITIKAAEQILLNDTDVSEDTDVEEDWFYKFYDFAGQVSDDSVQEIWAKILAGEVNSPGSYSKRTLSILSNLSKQDAELLVKIKNLLITVGGRFYFPTYFTTAEEQELLNITYEDILMLQEVGILYESSSQLTIHSSQDLIIYFGGKEFAFRLKPLPEHVHSMTVPLTILPVTIAGIQLLNLTESPTEYNATDIIKRYGEHVKISYSEVEVFEITRNKRNTKDYTRNRLLLNYPFRYNKLV
jgi:hypothetical protein